MRLSTATCATCPRIPGWDHLAAYDGTADRGVLLPAHDLPAEQTREAAARPRRPDGRDHPDPPRLVPTGRPTGSSVFMPSVSGWALRRRVATAIPVNPVFLCPRFRAGLCDRHRYSGCSCVQPFLCPRFRAGLCDVSACDQRLCRTSGFYALGFGLGFATSAQTSSPAPACTCFYALGFGLGFATIVRVRATDLHDRRCFYALGFGLGFATRKPTPRRRSTAQGFYALGFGLGFATSSCAAEAAVLIFGGNSILSGRGRMIVWRILRKPFRRSVRRGFRGNVCGKMRR